MDNTLLFHRGGSVRVQNGKWPVTKSFLTTFTIMIHDLKGKKQSYRVQSSSSRSILKFNVEISIVYEYVIFIHQTFLDGSRKNYNLKQEQAVIPE